MRLGNGFGTGLPQNIVVIGGGTGSSAVIRALTQEPFSGKGVTAIATTFDDGGGTGALREVYPDLPAVGDVRQCLDAMSQLSPIARDALASRFGSGDDSDRLNVEGQTLGNLVIARTIQRMLQKGGTFNAALEAVGQLLQIKGRVVAPSDDIRTLIFDLPDGTRVYGEHQAEQTLIPSFEGAKLSFLNGRRGTSDGAEEVVEPAHISREADAAIRDSDLVIIAPGDLYTSIAPNLSVEGMSSALKAAKAVIMISNLMNRDRHTVDFTVHTYAKEVSRLIGNGVIQHVIYNTGRPDDGVLQTQTAKGSHPVRPNLSALTRDKYGPRGFDLVSHIGIGIDEDDPLAELRSQIRHDPAKLAAAILQVYISGTTGR